jgi:ubiquinone/menaquinone biosynthesis C-methylase UbiE
MALPSFDPDNEKSISNYYRRKRFAFFNDLIKTVKKPFRILDVGGTQAYWDSMGFSDKNIQIILLNLGTTAVSSDNFTSVIGDATNLSEYKDNEFDLVFSNSVIEHLFTWENQVKMANEIRRVGKRYFVQTPNLYFPVEPHWVFPFFQFLPRPVKISLTQNFTLGHYPKAITREKSIERVNEVQLLTKQKMQQLFPDGKMYYEIVFGLTKSITAYNFPSI